MGFKDFTVDVSDPADVAEDKIVKIDGQTYKVIKKVGKKVAVVRHYWFNALLDKLTRRGSESAK